MKTWLFIWNPSNWSWDSPTGGYNELRREIAQVGEAYGKWSCGVNKSICKGDRIFLIQLGTKNKGIVASGFAETAVFESIHWDPAKAAAGKTTRNIYIRFDKILDIDKGDRLSYDQLQYIDHNYHWSPQASGVSIPENTANKVELHWKTH